MKAGIPRDIILKFTSYRVRRRVYGERTKAKVRVYVDVFINEYLTKSKKELFMKARRMVNNNLMKNAWSSDGSILVRDLSDTKQKFISESDLALFGPVPDLKRPATTEHQPILSRGSAPRTGPPPTTVSNDCN